VGARFPCPSTRRIIATYFPNEEHVSFLSRFKLAWLHCFGFVEDSHGAQLTTISIAGTKSPRMKLTPLLSWGLPMVSRWLFVPRQELPWPWRLRFSRCCQFPAVAFLADQQATGPPTFQAFCSAVVDKISRFPKMKCFRACRCLCTSTRI